MGGERSARGLWRARFAVLRAEEQADPDLRRQRRAVLCYWLLPPFHSPHARGYASRPAASGENAGVHTAQYSHASAMDGLT